MMHFSSTGTNFLTSIVRTEIISCSTYILAVQYYSTSRSLLLNVQYLRMLAGAYEKTQELAKELHSIGCGDLDVEGKMFTLFLHDFVRHSCRKIMGTMNGASGM